MTQGDAKRALEDACADGLKKVFVVLEANLISGDVEHARRQFKASCENYFRALAIATSVIEETFKG